MSADSDVRESATLLSDALGGISSAARTARQAAQDEQRAHERMVDTIRFWMEERHLSAELAALAAGVPEHTVRGWLTSTLPREPASRG